MPTLYNFSEIAEAAARYWSRLLDPRVKRPVGLREALVRGILDTQPLLVPLLPLETGTPLPLEAEVILCSRPGSYRTPGYAGVNVLAVVAYDLKLHLDDFPSGLVHLYPDQAPEYLIHPLGKPRPLLLHYPLVDPLVVVPLP